MKQARTGVIIRSAGVIFLVGSILLLGGMILGPDERVAFSAPTTALPFTIQSEQPLTCQAEACTSAMRLIDTRDHDNETTSGERVKKRQPTQKPKSDKSVKQESAKSKSGETRGADDRRDLKDEHSKTSDAQGTRPDDRRQGGENPANP